MRDVISSLSETAKGLGSDAASCLESACQYLATGSSDEAEIAQVKYLRLTAPDRKRTQNQLVIAAERVAPLSEPFDGEIAHVRAELLSIGNIYGRYRRRELATALQHSDVPNSLYTREDILLSTILGWSDLSDDCWHMVRLLLDEGADPNCHEEVDGWTPLHYAVHYGNEDLAELLFQYGANPNITDKKARKPMEMSSCSDAMASAFTRWQQKMTDNQPTS